MKKLLLSLLTFIFCTSVFATSYTQTAADISPGVFPDGNYYFPEMIVLGIDTDPGLDSTESTALYVNDGGNRIGITVVNDAGEIGIGVDGGSIGVSASGSMLGVSGSSTSGYGVSGTSTSTSSAGVYGSGSSIGVKAYSSGYGFYSDGAQYGLYIPSSVTYGVKAISDSVGGAFSGDITGVMGAGDTTGGYFNGDTYGVYAISSNYAIYASGKARVTGALTVGSCSGCDIAEHFLGDGLEPGDVVVLDSTAVRGVAKTTTPYDTLAVGIVSTDPTITMGLKEGVPIALSGVVPTKVVGKVNVGDLLTTSSTAGYAMACDDYTKCFGAIIGKAMEAQAGGTGKITAMVMLS
ncbi:MAG: hypothetical protein WC254_03800 [Candidatus Woesearchaeota archaeon]|jgi:hypothetical protein